jgi:sodium transport system permease protein
VTVAAKEIRDHCRDRRSLMSAALYSFLGPAVILLVAQSSAASTGGAPLLLNMMSVFALVSAFTGGMFLALDATAGERERGSLVPVLLNPIPSLQLIAGKWVAVAAFSVVGLALNLVAFTAVFEWSNIIPRGGMAWAFALWVVCGLVPLALLGAALHILTGTASRTLKDAQARLSTVTLVPMMTGMFLVFFPGTIGRWWFAIPVIGQQALFAEALRGHAVSLLQAGALAIVTLAATAALVLAASRVISRDGVAAG